MTAPLETWAGTRARYHGPMIQLLGKHSCGLGNICQSSLTGAAPSTRIDGMSEATKLAAEAGNPEPRIGLRAVLALRRLLERLEAIQVANAREQGWSWQEIADVLEVSKQAVHHKYNKKGRGS